MGKPVRREELAISPRLAKILINLSQAKENETLLDPFCGIGVILQEALLQGINAIGIDIDRQAIEDARKNLAWLSNNYSVSAKYNLINNDSKRVRLDKIDSIASEPSLGKLLEKVPSRQEAEVIIKKFENLIISVLNNLKNYLKTGGKIAFTSPLISLNHGRLGINVQEISKQTGLKQIGKLIPEFRDRQIVGRGIVVFQKITA